MAIEVRKIINDDTADKLVRYVHNSIPDGLGFVIVFNRIDPGENSEQVILRSQAYTTTERKQALAALRQAVDALEGMQ